MTELMAKAQSANGGITMTGRRDMPSILVVDDHADTRALLRYVFESHSCEVNEAEDGADAVGLTETIRPDLIVMDTALQRMDGFEATRRIRRMENVGNVPIVFLSGHAQPQARAQALACGANEYLVKPISLEELEIVVARQLLNAKQFHAVGEDWSRLGVNR
jgi:phosphoserine phosphatase RsbU/P